jgi:rod shape determining protein RodA
MNLSGNIKEFFQKSLGNIDWILFLATLPILGAGLVTMNSFTSENYFFDKQIIWIAISLAVFFSLSFVDFRFLKRAPLLVTLFLILCGVLLFTLALGKTVKGAQSWLHFGFFSFEPADPVKVLLIIILAKYFSRRHIEIAHFRHILVSGIYALIPFTLIFFQPDLGSAIVLFFIWLGMIMVSGVSKKHLLLVTLFMVVTFMVFWLFVFKPYQKARIITFLHPVADIQGAGYNANQSTIAVGSGQFFGKGVGYGTQSRLKFLPEYQTDFVFAAFAEEWGFGGVMLLFILFGIVIWRILANAIVGATNFEMLFGMGLAILFMTHFIINTGMNIGLLPVTGIPMPFMSYGGSHLLTEFMGLGILMGMRRYGRAAHRDMTKNEFLGI